METVRLTTPSMTARGKELPVGCLPVPVKVKELLIFHFLYVPYCQRAAQTANEDPGVFEKVLAVQVPHLESPPCKMTVISKSRCVFFFFF